MTPRPMTPTPAAGEPMSPAPGSSEDRVWRCGDRPLSLERPLVMGILNVTPDSFSDGGRFSSPDEAVQAGFAMAEGGADILDVGGESTRPGAEELSPDEEIRRVLPVVTGLASSGDVPVSIDTRHAEVAEACLGAGASIINDVSGFRDPAMVGLAARSSAGLIVMHMLGEPGTMQDQPVYDDVVAEIASYLREQAGVLRDAGVARERIAVDPGIGFGKTREHNLEILRRLPELTALGHPLVLGASRKRFIGMTVGGEPAERLEGSLAVAVWAALSGADVLRVHDVPETVKALRMLAAIVGGDGGRMARAEARS